MSLVCCCQIHDYQHRLTAAVVNKTANQRPNSLEQLVPERLPRLLDRFGQRELGSNLLQLLLIIQFVSSHGDRVRTAVPNHQHLQEMANNVGVDLLTTLPSSAFPSLIAQGFGLSLMILVQSLSFHLINERQCAHIIAESDERDASVGRVLCHLLELVVHGGLHPLQARHVRHVAALPRQELVLVRVVERLERVEPLRPAQAHPTRNLQPRQPVSTNALTADQQKSRFLVPHNIAESLDRQNCRLSPQW